MKERLRQWEVENAATYTLPPDLAEIGDQGGILNDLTRTNDGDYRVALDKFEQGTEDDTLTIRLDEMVDVGDKRGFLLPGDLVELR